MASFTDRIIRAAKLDVNVYNIPSALLFLHLAGSSQRVSVLTLTARKLHGNFKRRFLTAHDFKPVRCDIHVVSPLSLTSDPGIVAAAVPDYVFPNCSAKPKSTATTASLCWIISSRVVRPAPNSGAPRPAASTSRRMASTRGPCRLKRFSTCR